jgi:hypothetical protein
MCLIPESIVIPCCLLTSLLVRGIKIGEKSKLGWLMVFSRHALLADSLYFLQLLLSSAWRIWLHSSIAGDLWRHARHILMLPNISVLYSVCVPWAIQLTVCLFHQHNFCHIHVGCYTHSVLSAVDLCGLLLIIEPLSVFFVLNTVVRLYSFPVDLTSQRPLLLRVKVH